MEIFYINTSQVTREEKANILAEVDLSKPTIVEGCDLTGKDTIIDELSNLVDGSNVLHHTSNDDNSWFYWVMKYLTNIDTNNIFNRCHFSTDIYELVMNDDPKLNYGESESLFGMLFPLDINLILVDCDLDDLLIRYDARGDSYVTDIDKLVSIYIHYKFLINHVIRLTDSDYTVMTFDLLEQCSKDYNLHKSLDFDIVSEVSSNERIN